jgi:O-antigen/teichoic acid export membrane protein
LQANIRMKLLRLVKFIRLKPFDTGTTEGRSNERYRMAIWSFLANIISKIMALAVMLLSIRWTLPYLGAERFGIWMTIASFSTMLILLDLGIGNAIINRVASAAALDNPEKLKKTISGCLGFLFIISLAMGVLLYILATNLPIEKLIKLKNISLLPELRQTVIIFAILFGFNIFGSGVQKLFSGLQRTFESCLASAVCSLLALIGVWWAASHSAAIPLLLVLTLGIQTLGGYLLLLLLIQRKLFALKDIGRRVQQEYKQLFKTGALYFVLQMGVMIGWGSDSLIISSTLGVASVTMYSIAQRLFQFSILGLYMINGPLWGAYADANARQDKDFIKITLYRSMKLTFILSILSIAVIIIFNEFILEIWLANKVIIPLSFLLAFACWTFMENMSGAFGLFLNGMHIVKPQLVSVALFVSISLLMKLLLIEKYGIIVVPLATAFAYLMSTAVLYRFIYIKEIRQSIH